MEQESKKESVGAPKFKVIWHAAVRNDFSKLNKSLVGSIITAVDHRLSRAPEYLGQPLKGTTTLIWKIRFDKYRILYTLNVKAKEVWVLSVRKREIIYKDAHVQSLIRLAVAIQQQIGKS